MASRVKQLIHQVTFPRSSQALFDYLKGRTSLIARSSELFYKPIALIESRASTEDVKLAFDESMVFLKAQQDLLQRRMNSYSGVPRSEELVTELDEIEDAMKNDGEEDTWDD
jgi:hypothetical protein